MSEGFGWLPPSVAARIADEEAHELAAAKRDEAQRADQADQARERGLEAYRVAAGARGEVVSALAIARGEVAGRSLGEIFGDARDAADREDARASARQRREDGDDVYFGEPVIHGAARSAWPSSDYELDRLMRHADELHRDLVAVRARYNYRSAEVAARAKSEAGR